MHALEAIASLEEAGIAIIGGEVWQKESGRFRLNYDIWNIEREEFPEANIYLRQGWELAKSRVAHYLANKDVCIVVNV